MTTVLLILGLLALVLINVPIAVALGAVAVIGMVMSKGVDSIYNAALTMFDGATNFPLLAIPLFILAGALMNTTSISRRLINLTSALIGFVRGGLAMVNVGVSMFFAEISGSAVADVAAIGSVLIPAMKKRNYTPELSAAVTSSSASIAIIIPPSIAMIIYGALSDTSIVQLFVAGIIPGVLGGFSMMGLCYWYAVRYDLPREEAFSLSRLWVAFKEAGWALTLPVIILGGIFGGIVTATEGAGLAVVAALFIGGFIYREINWEPPEKSDGGRGYPDGRGHAPGCHVGGAWPASHRDAGAAAICLLDDELYQQQDHGTRSVERHAVCCRYVSAWRCRDHPDCPDRDAAGAPDRHQSDSVRSDHDPQYRHRPADPAGCKCAGHLLFDREN